ncbi:TetR/AcrR family transcriptional regulator [Streptomyces sp. NPDC023723]|uniref:TetR/AcrR family transcriptional regulator n=1 Tax=Streptomyces sp. NPDC023723 TaxID=3154323 RepID=UPI0033DD82BB
MGNNRRADGSSGDPRGRILAAALTVFSSRGFRGGSLNDIATAAGLTRAGLLHHFPSKQAVLLALLEKRDAELDIASPPEGTPLLQLIDRIGPLTEEVVANREMVQLSHILTAEASGEAHPAREWVARRYSQFRAHLASAVRRSIETGELRADLDPEAFGALILAVVEGSENQWLVNPERVDPAKVVHQLRTLCAVAGP